MSYGNMDEEIKEHQAFLKQSEITIGKLSLFVREFGKNGVKFIESSQKKMDEFFSELKKEDNSTTLSISLGHIYNEYTSFFKKMKAFFDSIDKTIGGKITDFEKDYKTKNKENLAKLSKLSMQINERKKKLDEVKNGYFDASREIKEIEKKMDPNKLKDDELLKMTQKKISAKEISEERKSQYQREVRDFNNFLETKEDEYLSTKAFFKNDQNDKLLFYIDILSNSNAIIKERNEVMEFTIKKVNKYKEDINIRRDLKLFDQDFNRINSSTKKRYMKEHFLNYDLRNKTDSLKDENNDEEVSLDNQDSKYMKALQILELGNDDFIDMTSLDEKDIEFNKKIMNLLENENKIEGELFLEITNYYKNNINHSRRFMYLLVNYFCVKEFVKIKNYDNFNILKNILCEIINYCFDKKEIFDIVYLIMFIANKTIYYNKEKNTVEYYLCNEMSNNKIFKNNDFWLELLNKKLNMISEVEITKEMEKRRNSLGKEDSTIVGQAIGKLGKFGKFFGIGNNNKAIEKEIIFNQMFQRYSPNFCNRVISDYIRQFINYNYDGKSSLKVIENLSNKYKLPKDYLEYYKKVIETNEIIRKKMNKNKNISIDKGNYDKYYFNFKGNKKFEGIADTKIYSLIFSLKFLDVKEYPKILCLNKDLNKKLMKIIYKNILFKYFDKLNIKTHISIWKILLNYTEVKKKYNYTKILEEVEKDPNLVKNLDIIGLDVIRTSFDKDEPIKRKKIGNILKAVAKEIPSLNYCQGMNQIASFLLDVCDNDEEESFFVFLCLLLDSDYSNLFKNDLEKLNILFYQFDRILSNTLPEIYTYLKNNKITPGFFISPWFITIFTDAFIDKEELNNKKIIMKIFDQFILGGWKAIVKIGLSLLKYNEVRILNTPIEELLNYLTNDIIKSTYFDKDNFDDVMNASIKFKINGAILSDTEKQYNMQKQLAPLE
jgi:hypothetical protein